MIQQNDILYEGKTLKDISHYGTTVGSRVRAFSESSVVGQKPVVVNIFGTIVGLRVLLDSDVEVSINWENNMEQVSYKWAQWDYIYHHKYHHIFRLPQRNELTLSDFHISEVKLLTEVMYNNVYGMVFGVFFNGFLGINNKSGWYVTVGYKNGELITYDSKNLEEHNKVLIINVPSLIQPTIGRSYKKVKS